MSDTGPVDVPKTKCECPFHRGEDVKPVPMVLFCPRCHMQHVDQVEIIGSVATDWATRPHLRHVCVLERGGCGFEWQPALVYTVGVGAIL